MATWKQVILKDPITGEYLAPMGGNFSGGNADTLQSHPASDFLLKSEYTPVDLSEYLKTATADTKYAAVSHNHNGVYAPVSHTHTTGQISDLSTVLAGYAPASHTHTTANITGLDTKLSGYDSEIASLKSSVSNGKSLIASAITDKGVSTASNATFQTMADNIESIKTGVEVNGVEHTASIDSSSDAIEVGDFIHSEKLFNSPISCNIAGTSQCSVTMTDQWIVLATNDTSDGRYTMRLYLINKTNGTLNSSSPAYLTYNYHVTDMVRITDEYFAVRCSDTRSGLSIVLMKLSSRGSISAVGGFISIIKLSKVFRAGSQHVIVLANNTSNTDYLYLYKITSSGLVEVTREQIRYTINSVTEDVNNSNRMYINTSYVIDVTTGQITESGVSGTGFNSYSSQHSLIYKSYDISTYLDSTDGGKLIVGSIDSQKISTINYIDLAYKKYLDISRYSYNGSSSQGVLDYNIINYHTLDIAVAYSCNVDSQSSIIISMHRVDLDTMTATVIDAPSIIAADSYGPPSMVAIKNDKFVMFFSDHKIYSSECEFICSKKPEYNAIALSGGSPSDTIQIISPF